MDSGSTDTLVSSRVYHEMAKEQRPVLEVEETNIQQVDGSPLSVMGIAWVDVQLGRTVCPVRAIFADIRYDGILGMDFLLPTCGNLDFRSLELRLNGERLKCTSGAGEPFIGRVLVAETTEIPAGHEAVVPGEVATTCKTDEQTAIIEPVEGGGELAERGLLLARSQQTRAQVLPLRILNPNREKRVVQKGTAVGTIATVVADSISTFSHESEGKVEGDLPSHLHDLFDRSKANLSEDYHAQVKSCLLEFQDVFSSGEHDIGRTEVVKHQINTGDARPIKERPRRHPFVINKRL